MYMNLVQKTFLLFLVGCIGARTLFMLAAKNICLKYLPLMGYVAAIPAFGFAYIYITKARTKGILGQDAWWDDMRPVHSLLYSLFAYNAIMKNRDAWMFLLIDVIIGLVNFLLHHYRVGNFSKLHFLKV